MASRFGIPLAICLCMTSSAAAQVVRFDTTMGNFDMVLNPTNNPQLQGYVDNFLNYVEGNNYLGSWINRADTENGTPFVLQMGGFFSHTKRPPPTIQSTRPVATFAPVTGVPAQSIGLSNTVGTVALALPGGANGVNHDAGTSSFFINLNDNSFLDPDFTVFAEISDLTVINQIMALQIKDQTSDPSFGTDSSNLGFTSDPIQGDGFQVFIKEAFVVTDSLIAAKAKAAVQSNLAQSAANFAADASAAMQSGGAGESLLSSTNPVPEPGSFFLTAVGALGMGRFAIRRRRRS